MDKANNNNPFGKKSTKHFLHYVAGKCKKHGIKLILRNVKYLKLSGNIKCSGYFDDSKKELVVSMNRKDSLEILVHEFGHLTQYVDNCDVWKYLGNSLNYVDEWLTGTNVRNYEKHIDASRDLELDNEKRSVEIIKKFGLDIDIDNYIKKANSYIYFYTWMKKTRKWSTPQNSPYTNKNVLSVMPSKFQKRYDKIPKKIQKVFESENI